MPRETFFNLPEEKRDRIIELAIEEFANNDYNNASISRIVARAGIAKGSFYQYFDDKKDLYLYLIKLAGDEKMAFLKSLQPPDPHEGMFGYLRWLFVAGTRFEFSNPGLTQVGYRAMYGDNPIREETWQQLKAQQAGFYENLLEIGITQGDVDPDIDRDIAAFILRTLFAELGQYLMERMELDPAELAEADNRYLLEVAGMKDITDHFFDLLQNGLGTRSSKPNAQSAKNNGVNHD